MAAHLEHDDVRADALDAYVSNLVSVEFPDLPDDRHAEVIAFCLARIERMPDGLRIGVRSTAAVARLAVRLARPFVGDERVDAALRRTSCPVVGDLARLVRSLAVARIWERWPDTSPTGRPTGAHR